MKITEELIFQKKYKIRYLQAIRAHTR